MSFLSISKWELIHILVAYSENWTTQLCKVNHIRNHWSITHSIGRESIEATARRQNNSSTYAVKGSGVRTFRRWGQGARRRPRRWGCGRRGRRRGACRSWGPACRWAASPSWAPAPESCSAAASPSRTPTTTTSAPCWWSSLQLASSRPPSPLLPPLRCLSRPPRRTRPRPAVGFLTFWSCESMPRGEEEEDATSWARVYIYRSKWDARELQRRVRTRACESSSAEDGAMVVGVERNKEAR